MQRFVWTIAHRIRNDKVSKVTDRVESELLKLLCHDGGGGVIEMCCTLLIVYARHDAALVGVVEHPLQLRMPPEIDKTASQTRLLNVPMKKNPGVRPISMLIKSISS